MLLSDLHEDAVARRLQEEADALYYDRFGNRIPSPPSGGPISGCLRCGWPVEESQHLGRVWLFDRGGDALHVCQPTQTAIMERVRREMRRTDDLP